MNWIQRLSRYLISIAGYALSGFLLVWIALSQSTAFAQQKSVFVLGVQDVAANDDIRDGLREGLKWGGFFEGKAFKLTFEEAEPERLKMIMSKAITSKPDAIVAIAPSAIQAAVSTTRHYPVVYINVADSVDAIAFSPEDTNASNVTGLTSNVPIARQIAVIKQLVPGARKVGVVYNPNDPASVSKIKELQEQMAKLGLALLDASAARPGDVGAAARSLISRVDAFYSFDDVNVTKSYAALVKVANDAKLPLIASNVNGVRQGATAAIVVTDRDLGVQAGKMLTRILRGTTPVNIKPEIARPLLMLNLNAAQKQGVVVSDALIKSAGEILR